MECDFCKYVTDVAYNFKRHCESQSHIDRVNRYISTQTIRHNNKIQKDKSIYDELMSQREILNKISNGQIKLSKQQIVTDSKVTKIKQGVKKLTDYVDFLNEYCPDAKSLKKLTRSEVEDLLKIDDYKDKPKYYFEEKILSYMRTGKLHIKLGDLIGEKYLNPDELRKQMVWISDLTRMSYIFLQGSGAKKTWIRDKKGKLFAELIADPIIDLLEERMLKFAKYSLAKCKDGGDVNENMKTMENAQDAMQFKCENVRNELKNDMLKYTAGKFSICEKKEKILDECET